MKKNKQPLFFRILGLFLTLVIFSKCFSNSDSNGNKEENKNEKTVQEKTVTPNNINENSIFDSEQGKVIKKIFVVNKELLGEINSISRFEKDSNMYFVEADGKRFKILFNPNSTEIGLFSLSMPHVIQEIIDIDSEYKIDKKQYKEVVETLLPKAEERKDSKEQFKGQFNPLNNSHIKLVKAVKENLKNTKSFKHVETTYEYIDKSKTIELTMIFKAKNSLGAYIENTATATSDIDGNLSNLKIVY